VGSELLGHAVQGPYPARLSPGVAQTCKGTKQPVRAGSRGRARPASPAGQGLPAPPATRPLSPLLPRGAGRAATWGLGRAEYLLHTHAWEGNCSFPRKSRPGHPRRPLHLHTDRTEPQLRGQPGPGRPPAPLARQPRPGPSAARGAGGCPCARHPLGDSRRLSTELCCWGGLGRGAGLGPGGLLVFHFLHAKEKACSGSPVELSPPPVTARELEALVGTRRRALQRAAAHRSARERGQREGQHRFRGATEPQGCSFPAAEKGLSPLTDQPLAKKPPAASLRGQRRLRRDPRLAPLREEEAGTRVESSALSSDFGACF